MSDMSWDWWLATFLPIFSFFVSILAMIYAVHAYNYVNKMTNRRLEDWGDHDE